MRLIADIGGTNARFSLSSGPGDIGTVEVLPVAAHASFEDALARFLSGREAAVDSAAIAAAGPIDAGRIRMTNAPWVIAPEVLAALGTARHIHILNDLEAVGYALPVLSENDLEDVQKAVRHSPASNRLAVNVGTGFGAALSVRVDTGWTVVATEAGHMTLPRRGAREEALFGEAETIEDALSGPGLHRLHARLGAAEVRRDLSRLLGRISGDLALATGAWGGVYLCGGVLDRFDEVIARDAFVEGFGDRTGVAARLANVPVYHIRHPVPAMLGLSIV